MAPENRSHCSFFISRTRLNAIYNTTPQQMPRLFVGSILGLLQLRIQRNAPLPAESLSRNDVSTTCPPESDKPPENQTDRPHTDPGSPAPCTNNRHDLGTWLTSPAAAQSALHAPPQVIARRLSPRLGHA